MLNYLTEDQFEQLRQHLIVPLAMGDILQHDLEVGAEMQYGLHMAISEIDPDSALLAIALCALDIADKNIINSPIAAGLKKDAENIIEDYGPTWLRHYKKGPMPPETFESILDTVPEDLEAMADLMDALCADLNNDGSTSVLLANLLSIQARAHMEIADFILAEMAFDKATKESEKSGDSSTAPTKELIDMDAYTGNNILIFPGATKH